MISEVSNEVTLCIILCGFLFKETTFINDILNCFSCAHCSAYKVTQLSQVHITKQSFVLKESAILSCSKLVTNRQQKVPDWSQLITAAVTTNFKLVLQSSGVRTVPTSRKAAQDKKGERTQEIAFTPSF